MERKKNEDDSGSDSEGFNDEAMARLQAIIRSLEAEKNLLNKRLTDANSSNLDRMTADGYGLEAGKVIEKYFHMPDTGLVWSSQELTPALKQQYPDPRAQAFCSIYVTDFESDITSAQNIQEMLKPLREAQEEIAEMKHANDDLIEKVTELEAREVSMELEKTKLQEALEAEKQESQSLREKIQEHENTIEAQHKAIEEQKTDLQNLRDEHARHLEEAAQREKELQEKLEAALAEIERKNKLLEDSQAANKVLSDKYDRECQDRARLQNQHNILLDTRYIVDRKTVEVTKVERLSDIEMQLFRGIQEINKEKGRREYKPEPEEPLRSGAQVAHGLDANPDSQTGAS